MGPRRVTRTALKAAAIKLAFLLFRASELMPLEELWRGLKATVVASQCYPTLEDLTHHAIDWLHAMTRAERLRRWGFQSSNCNWFPA